MDYGICTVSICPIRIEPSEKSEMVSQLLFGEHFNIIEETEKWTKIINIFDNYTGWIDNKLYTKISQKEFNNYNKKEKLIITDLLDKCTDLSSKSIINLVIGSTILNNEVFNIGSKSFKINTAKEITFSGDKNIVKTAFKYLNSPYLWGGRTPFGIDCSGFVQIVYKLNGINLLRDASQQVNQGIEVLLENSKIGDLAFFENENKKIIHVGILISENKIIHASGKVRIDLIDENGILNIETNKYSHKLSVVKRVSCNE